MHERQAPSSAHSLISWLTSCQTLTNRAIVPRVASDESRRPRTAPSGEYRSATSPAGIPGWCGADRGRRGITSGGCLSKPQTGSRGAMRAMRATGGAERPLATRATPVNLIVRKTVSAWSPVTESNRRPSPYHKYGPVHRACLAAPMTRIIALIALAVLGLSGAPCHAPCHAGRRRAVPRARRRAVPRGKRRVQVRVRRRARIAGSPGHRPCRPWAACAAGRWCRSAGSIGDLFRGLAVGRTMTDCNEQFVIN